MLVDSHCHLDMLDSEGENQLNDYLTRARENRVQYLLNVCVTLNDFAKVLSIAQTYPDIGASVGLHPNEEGEVDVDTLVQLGQDPKVIAVGETGLDYFRSEGDTSWQRERFRQHIEAAKKLKKPIIVHTRNAKEDTLKILIEEDAKSVSGVMHCFTEDWSTAKQALDLGFYISFSGIVTFKNAPSLQAVAKQVPIDRILIETDAPYLAPNPVRGKPNEPAYIKYTAEFLAHLRGMNVEDFAEHSTNNFFRLFTGATRPHV